MLVFSYGQGYFKGKNRKGEGVDRKGCDWERRNRLKIYEASYQLIMRDFEGASENLMSSIATFTCYEVMTYKTFVSYAVLLGMLTLKRGELKKKIIDSPDILTVIRELPELGVFLTHCMTAITRIISVRSTLFTIIFSEVATLLNIHTTTSKKCALLLTSGSWRVTKVLHWRAWQACLE